MPFDRVVKSRLQGCLLAGSLALGGLTAPAIAEETRAVNPKVDSATPAPAASAQATPTIVRIPQRPVSPPEIGRVDLEAFSARLKNANAMKDVDAAVSALQKMLAELKSEKAVHLAYQQELLNYINELKSQIVKLSVEIESVKSQIDDLDGLMDPFGIVLLKRNALSDTMATLKRVRAELNAELSRTGEELAKTKKAIERVGELMRTVEEMIKAMKEKLKDLKKEALKVSVTAPSEGDRIFAGKSGQIRIRSLNPPTLVRIQIEWSSPAASSGKLTRVGWSRFYDSVWRWDQLGGRANSIYARLSFETGVVAKQGVAPGSDQDIGMSKSPVAKAGRAGPRNLPSLPVGNFRVRVGRDGSSISGEPWRRFSVVGASTTRRLTPDSSDPSEMKVRPSVKVKTGLPPKSATKAGPEKIKRPLRLDRVVPHPAQ